MSADEPDSTPVRPEHVLVFVEWYRQRVQAPDIAFAIEWWQSGLHTLTLGELRHGMRSLKRFESKLVLSPPEFWQLCKGTQNEQTLARFRALRETVRRGSEPPPPQDRKQRARMRVKEEVVRPRIERSGHGDQ